MNATKTIRRTAVSAVLVLFTIALINLKPASAQEWSLQQVAAKGTYAETVAKVKKGIAKGGMMVLGEIDQGKILSMTGLKLKAVSLFIGNPTMGKKLFSADPGVGIAVPVRVNIFEGKNGKVYVNYVKPSVQLAPFQNKAVIMAGSKLDQKLGKLLSMLAK